MPPRSAHSGSTPTAIEETARPGGLGHDVSRTAAAKLVYARLGADLLPVGEFRGRSAVERRAAVCPACAAPVTIRLGQRRVWHVAHRARSDRDCGATAGETALHLNTKIALRDALVAFVQDPAKRRADGGAPLLEIALPCVGADCDVPAYREWPVEWDEVRVECRVGAHQPDLVLFRNARPVGAVEVLVSHAVTPEKAAALRALEVPWLEVSAFALNIGGLGAWTVASPLPVHRASLELGRWRCPRHEATAQLAEARARYAAMRNKRHPDATVLVDYGRKLREMEVDTHRLIAEAQEIRSKALAYEADHQHRLAMLPTQVADARRRLAHAKRELELAQHAAQERRESIDGGVRQRDTLEDELRGLDAELTHFESLRRALSTPSSGIDSQPNAIGRRTLFWCPFDVYRVRGHMGRPSRSRGVFRVDRVAIEGKTPELWLVDDTNRCLHRVEAGDAAAGALLLDALDRRLCEWLAQGRIHAVIVDRPSEWIPVPLGEEVPDDAWELTNTRVPPSYEWDSDKRRWLLRSREIIDP